MAVHYYIGRFEVSVDERLFFPGIVQGFRDAVSRIKGGQYFFHASVLCYFFSEGFSFYKFRGQVIYSVVGDSCVVYLDDSGVVEVCGHACFVEEASDEGRISGEFA